MEGLSETVEVVIVLWTPLSKSAYVRRSDHTTIVEKIERMSCKTQHLVDNLLETFPQWKWKTIALEGFEPMNEAI